MNRSLKNLEIIFLDSNPIGPKGARAIAASDQWPSLNALHLDSTGIGDDGTEALAHSKYLIDLEKLYIFLTGLNRKLPQRLTDRPDIFTSVDLEYFKIEKEYTTNIELEDKDGEFQGISEDGGTYSDDEPTDLLSEIIKTLNESFDGEFIDDDRVRIEKIKEQIHENEELRMVMEGDNTDSNKRDMFNRTFEKLLTGLPLLRNTRLV